MRFKSADNVPSLENQFSQRISEPIVPFFPHVSFYSTRQSRLGNFIEATAVMSRWTVDERPWPRAQWFMRSFVSSLDAAYIYVAFVSRLRCFEKAPRLINIRAFCRGNMNARNKFVTNHESYPVILAISYISSIPSMFHLSQIAMCIKFSSNCKKLNLKSL